MSLTCGIVVIMTKDDDVMSEFPNLPCQAKLLSIGSNLKELQASGSDFKQANVLLRAHAFTPLTELLAIIDEMPRLCWIHSLAAGVDNMLCPEITKNDKIIITNSKGVFNHVLAEFVMLSCSYFAKNVPRLMAQKAENKWEKFFVSELRGKKMGIVGYGDIGKSCAKLAKAYGMDVIGLKRNPADYIPDGYCDQIYGPNDINYLMNNADYLVISLALTSNTYHFIKKEQFENAKKNLIIINVGRGCLIDEEAMIIALESGMIAGASLDAFTVEPLPSSSKLWSLPNVFISPHTNCIGIRTKSMKTFLRNCGLFIKGQQLDNMVDKESGY